MTIFTDMLKVEKKEWNVYSQNLCAFGQKSKDKKQVFNYFNTEEKAIALAKEFNYSCTDKNFFKVEKTIF
tara:strand:- start:75 stop:284 length:210 start_codon:yes stop_codon:yes gene_type:complete